MNQLLHFDINPTTWFYLSLLLVVAIYFKFTRFWALRNLDLIALLCLTPGWLLLDLSGTGNDKAEAVTTGQVWLLAGSGWWMLRLLLDPLLRRRPQLEPNMSPAGLTVVGVAVLGAFITYILVHSFNGADLLTVPTADTAQARSSDTLTPSTAPVVGEATPEPEIVADGSPDTAERVSNKSVSGPGRLLLESLGVLPGGAIAASTSDFSDIGGASGVPANGSKSSDTPEPLRDTGDYQFTARTVLILGHIAVVAGLVLAALCHFGKLVTGVGIAVLYLLLPYTAYHMLRIDQVVLGASLVWAVVAYRRPAITGVLLATASFAFYFPVFLLPLWTAFYWQRGLRRFWIAIGTTTLVLFAAVAVIGNLAAIGAHLAWVSGELAGQVWRIPVLVTYLVVCGAVALGPQPKNLGTLIAHSGVILLGMHFWYMPFSSGYVLWHLPLVLLVVFRPNLKGRAMVSSGTVNGEVPARDAKMAAA